MCEGEIGVEAGEKIIASAEQQLERIPAEHEETNGES
jgi:hypothetical protein